MEHNVIWKRWSVRAASALLLLAAISGLAACNKPATPPQQEQAKRYHLTGKIVSLHPTDNSVEIDGDDIPGFMAAMTMSYSVRSAQSLAGLNPGDEITADVVVPADSSAYIENIVVTKKGTAAAPPKGAQRQPQPGERVPDFALTDQDGKRVQLSSFRGSALLVTFIYTQCPFQEYCPLVSKNFAQIYAAARQDRALGSKIRLLSVSFDPEHDTPAVLRRYAQTFRQTTGRDPFDRWQFTVVPRKELPDVADFFGLYIDNSKDQLVHSLSTTVISPDGTVYKWYMDNSWKPADLLADAAASMQHPADVPATAQALNVPPKDSVAVRSN